MGVELTCSMTPTLTYDLFCLEGVITIGSLVAVTGEFNKYLSKPISKDVVIELSKVSNIDSGGVRFLSNLKKKVEANKRHLFLLKPVETVTNSLKDASAQDGFAIIDSNETLEKQVEKDTYEMYLPFTKEEKGLLRLSCSCAVCGSSDVVGYLINQNILQWQWKGDDPFPRAINRETGKEFPYFNILPIVCLECCMASLKISDFNCVANGSVAIKSIMKDESKQLLSKSIKKRKRIMESISVQERFFISPRESSVAYHCYLLAEFCARTSAILKSHITAFDIGYLNYLCINYAETKNRDEHVNNCRTWFTQAINSPELPLHEKIISYFVLFVSNLNLNKAKDASLVLTDFGKEMEHLPSTMVTTEGYNSPSFWYKQAEVIWKREIMQKSTILKE